MSDTPFPSRSVERRVKTQIGYYELEAERDRLRELLRRARAMIEEADECAGAYVVSGELAWPSGIAALLADIREALSDE